MDYMRKIGKSDEPKKWVKQFTTIVSTRDGLMGRDREFAEDRRLVNWRKWLANRKKQYGHIQSSTGRPQIDQVLNSCEAVRPLVEIRTLMDHANVPVPVIPDKFRGGPEFWRTPQVLTRHADSGFPDVTFTPSKKELNIAPELTYVDLPELLEKEKDLVGLRAKKPLWKRSQYLTKRRSELSREIELLAPMEPSTNELVIEGHAPRLKKKPLRIPPITVSDTEEGHEGEICPDQAIVLRIQDREIVWQSSAFDEEQTKPDPITWNLTFSSEIDRRAEKEIVFENKGNRVIIFQWRDPASRNNDKVVPPKRRMSPFFFNKTKGVIPPGQIVKLKVWYKPQVAGVFREFWNLLTDPKLCPSSLVFRFWGCAATSAAQIVKSNPVAVVDGYLDRCIRDATVREIIDEIMDDVGFKEPPEPLYGSLFLESEIFAAKNPLCSYHSSTLIELHKIYCSVTNQTEQRWNLSLSHLRDILLNIKEPEYRRTMLSLFSKLYKECLKPTLHAAGQYTKHEVVFQLICSFLNRFEAESEHARNACFVRELKEAGDRVSDTNDTAELVNASQVSVKSSNSGNKRGERSTIHARSAEIQGTIGNAGLITNDRPYKEIFFIRIHELLGQTMERILASIDSFNNLNERDK
ncbi:MYCBP-associated protein [Andrena cerasifolii]|uniref:MYCBP-associated protein n=1 Tax=Andrena cerasifolii TaxID=2819439 RepID=UPI004037AF70